MKKKGKKKSFAFVVAAAIFSATGIYAYANRLEQTAAVYTDDVKVGPLTMSVNVSGLIESASSTSVYSKEAFPAKEVMVKEGEQVYEGALLCVLDMEELNSAIERLQIAVESANEVISQEKTGIESSIENTTNSVKSAQLAYDKQKLAYNQAKKDYESGTNADLEKLKLLYETAKSNFENEDSAELLKAKADIEVAETTLQMRNSDLNAQKILYEGGGATKAAFDAAQTAADNAKTNYDSAVSAYEKLLENLKKTYEQYEIDIEKIKDNIVETYKRAGIDLKSAETAYQSAEAALKQANSQGTSISELNKSNQEVELESMLEKRSNAQIKSPSSGTVTYVNIKVGQMPAGVIFTIEDMESLQVKTYIKEYDLKSVRLDQPCIIKTDATGDREYSGRVSYIAPTSRKDVVSANNIEFEAKISILNADENLRIGMNARISIIREQKDDAMYVPYDCLIKNKDGEYVIYTVAGGTVKEIPVSTGIESDMYIEIFGEGIKEGLAIVTDPSVTMPGAKVVVREIS
ncbi:MAG: efflux RND transporter periplasmic adaptor subunit [Clostridiales bacterium]|nr:efflux RND transporter periplasmic adaptor subunit [Clostridiales bacterium]